MFASVTGARRSYRRRPDEGPGIFDQVGDDLADAQFVAVDQEACFCARLAVDDVVDLHGLLAVAYLLGQVDHITQQHFHVDLLGIAARQLGIQPGRVGNVADQAIEPPDIVLDDIHQPLLGIVVACERQRFDGAAQRRQRVLELVADIGREAFDGIDAVVEGGRHFPECNRQIADFVLTSGKIRDFLAHFRASADPDGRSRQPP